MQEPFQQEDYDWTNPRQVIPEVFLTYYPSRSKTLELRHDRATNDPDKRVREFARQKLAELEERK